MSFTTRTKITLLFSSIVIVLVGVLNVFIFQSANSVWQSKKAEYMHQAMDEALSIEDAKKMIADLQVESSTGLILHKQ
jgi:sensor histidine kinase regulating citrate/malate metabolism